MASPTQWTWVWVNSGSWWWTGMPGCRDSWGCKESDTTERLNWTEIAQDHLLFSEFSFFFPFLLHILHYFLIKFKLLEDPYFRVPSMKSGCHQLFVTPWTVACQIPLSMEFSRQEYWSGLPFPSPGDLPDSGIEPGSPTLRADLYCLSHRESKFYYFYAIKIFLYIFFLLTVYNHW